MTTRDEFEEFMKDRGCGHILQKEAGSYVHAPSFVAFDAWQARQQEIDTLKAEIEKLKSNDHIVDANKMVLPSDVIHCLRFYGNGEHFYIDPDGKGFDTVSGELENWLCSQRKNDATMFENGGLARAVLCGYMIEGDPESQPIEGEVYRIAPDQFKDKLNTVLHTGEALNIIQKALNAIERPDGLHDRQWEYIKHGIRMLARSVNEVTRSIEREE